MWKLLQDLEEQKRTKYKINGTATTALWKLVQYDLNELD